MENTPTQKNLDEERKKLAQRKSEKYIQNKNKAYAGNKYDFNPLKKVDLRSDIIHAMKMINKDTRIDPCSVEILNDFLTKEIKIILNDAKTAAFDFSGKDKIRKEDIEVAVKLRFHHFYPEEEIEYLLDYGERAVEFCKGEKENDEKRK